MEEHKSPIDELRDLVDRFFDDRIDAAGIARIDHLIVRDQACLQTYVERLDFHVGLIEQSDRLPSDAAPLGATSRFCGFFEDGNSYQSRRYGLTGVPGSTRGDIARSSASWVRNLKPSFVLGGIAAFATLLLGILFLRSATDLINRDNLARDPVAAETISQAASEDGPGRIDFPAGPQQARLRNAANADLFGELLPALGAPLDMERRYVLSQGMLELLFPAGAVVVIDAPAIFQIDGPDTMNLSLGHCSVYAPPGAEGFQVITPRSEVTDLGTRFTVRVDEGGDSDLHVIEGMARIHPKDTPHAGVVLLQGDARRAEGHLSLAPIAFDVSQYRGRLPDRVISYEALPAEEGPFVHHLQSVTVQRGGHTIQYHVDDLIGIEVIEFVAGAGTNCMILDRAELPKNPTSPLSENVALNSGLGNFGGRRSSSDRNDGADGSPRRGMGIRFREPVVNGPGPDVVLFEVQSLVNPPDGDQFWVGPLTAQPDLTTHHVVRFDITLKSAEAKPIPPFHNVILAEPPRSVGELSQSRYRIRMSKPPYHALAVGIDLSDLGYPLGTKVDGLFLESDESGKNLIDVVLIGGLPRYE